MNNNYIVPENTTRIVVSANTLMWYTYSLRTPLYII